MNGMTLAEKVAADFVGSQFWHDRRKEIEESNRNRRAEMREMQSRGEAVKEAFAAFRYWPLKLESDNPEPLVVAAEIRELMAKMERILYGRPS